MIRPEVVNDNCLLAALMKACGPGWPQQLQRVDLSQGQVLCEPGRPQHFAYFPTTAIVSLQYMTQDGSSAEIAVVGREGMVGTALFLGGGATTWQASVLIEGQALRIGAQAIEDAFERSVAARQIMLRYTQALAVQIAQTGVCNRHHAIEQQLCGWLLHGLDRLRGAEVVATHELIASMLGVRRESVTKAAHHLQEAGLIHYARGHIAVLDRAGLEQRACECHAVVKKEYDRLLPHEPRAAPTRQEAALAAL
jgi:CRP-like cAMP-binding protein